MRVRFIIFAQYSVHACGDGLDGYLIAEKMPVLRINRLLFLGLNITMDGISICWLSSLFGLGPSTIYRAISRLVVTAVYGNCYDFIRKPEGPPTDWLITTTTSFKHNSVSYRALIFRL
ncbi:hypothetical protein BDW68DRAFT_53808 [Aspergillus falconensis]